MDRGPVGNLRRRSGKAVSMAVSARPGRRSRPLPHRRGRGRGGVGKGCDRDPQEQLPAVQSAIFGPTASAMGVDGRSRPSRRRVSTTRWVITKSALRRCRSSALRCLRTRNAHQKKQKKIKKIRGRRGKYKINLLQEDGVAASQISEDRFALLEGIHEAGVIRIGHAEPAGPGRSSAGQLEDVASRRFINLT